MNEFREGWKTLFAATIGTMCGIFTLTNYTQGFFCGPSYCRVWLDSATVPVELYGDDVFRSCDRASGWFDC